MMENNFNLPPDQNYGSPEASRTMYDVTVSDIFGICSIKDDFNGSSWAWKFYEDYDKRPSMKVVLSVASSTLHHVTDLTDKDYLDPPCHSVQPNDQDMLGVRVQLDGLVGRKDLNGSVGRCGFWHKEKERYQIFLPPYDKKGPFTFCVKPQNLNFAEPLNTESLAKIVKNTKRSGKFPSVLFMCLLSPGKRYKSYLDQIFEPLNNGEVIATDTYRGPVSAQAQAMLRSVCGPTPFSNPLGLYLAKPSPTKKNQDMIRKAAILETFYKEIRERDKEKVKVFESSLVGFIDDDEICTEWLKLTVSLDGVFPVVTRELIVRADVSFNSLHNQILCPSIGWCDNYHCYAFRRIFASGEREDLIGRSDEERKVAIQKRVDECWIGPKYTSALDAIHQPLYIGGDVANDKFITLQHLFPKDSGTMRLQYVQ